MTYWEKQYFKDAYMQLESIFKKHIKTLRKLIEYKSLYKTLTPKVDAFNVLLVLVGERESVTLHAYDAKEMEYDNDKRVGSALKTLLLNLEDLIKRFEIPHIKIKIGPHHQLIIENFSTILDLPTLSLGEGTVENLIPITFYYNEQPFINLKIDPHLDDDAFILIKERLPRYQKIAKLIGGTVRLEIDGITQVEIPDMYVQVRKIFRNYKKQIKQSPHFKTLEIPLEVMMDSFNTLLVLVDERKAITIHTYNMIYTEWENKEEAAKINESLIDDLRKLFNELAISNIEIKIAPFNELIIYNKLKNFSFFPDISTDYLDFPFILSLKERSNNFTSVVFKCEKQDFIHLELDWYLKTKEFALVREKLLRYQTIANLIGKNVRLDINISKHTR